MWDKLKRRYPLIYEALEWAVFGLSLAAFLLALEVYFK